MAVRATQDLKNAVIKSYLSASATDITAGRGVKFGSTDTEITNAGAGDDNVCIGFALETVLGGSKRVQVCTLSGSPICPVIVGTGGVTRGARIKLTSDGVTTAGGTDQSVGRAVQTGVIGDLVGATLAPTST